MDKQPDVLFKGGNNTIFPTKTVIDIPDSLQLLSTHFRSQDQLLTTTSDTSAATYLTARFSTFLWDRYPAL